MSKHLIKILSICALIVLVPLIIVGSALCVTEAAPVTLTVYEGGEIYGTDESEYPTTLTVQVENEEPVTVTLGESITVKKNSLITLNYSGSVVYDFDGWFLGTDQQVTEGSQPEEISSKYQFRIRNNTNITAIKNIKKFDIVYSGYYDDGETPIEYESDLVNYGDALYAPTSIAGASFEGWYIDSATTVNTTTYTNATFNVTNRDSNNEYITITLKPFWSNQMTLTYYESDGTTLITQEILSEREFNNYTLLTAEQVASSVTPGYEFTGWLYEGDLVTEIGQIEFVDGASKVLVLSESKIEIAQVTYYAQDSSTVIAQFNLRENEYSSHELLSASDSRVSAHIPYGYEFNAWTSEDGRAITSLEGQIPFVDGEIKLILSVKERENILVTYFTSQNGEQIAQVKLYQDQYDEYALLTESDITEYLKAGYNFIGWKDAENAVFTKDNLEFVNGKEYTLYMNNELVNYDVTVQFNAIDTDQTTTLTYNVENNFSTYAVERRGYTFVGLIYNGNTYTLNGTDYIYNGTSLGNAVVANNGLTVTALWQVEEAYGEYVWTVGFAYEDGTGMEAVYDGSHNIINDVRDDYQTIFADEQGVGYRQLEDVILDVYFDGIDLDNLYVLVDGDYVKANVTGIYVTVDDNMNYTEYSFSSDATFIDIFDVLDGLLGDNTQNITVMFLCEVA